MLQKLFTLFAFSLVLSVQAYAARQPTIQELVSLAEAGDVPAAFELGRRFDYGIGVPKDTPIAAKWYRQAAMAGLAEAQNSLGSLYQAGEGVEQSYTEALSWYGKADAQGHAEAAHNLAFLYDLGQGAPEDNARAISLYEKAARAGFATSMLNLAVMYAGGDGVEKNFVDAYKWIELARFYTQKSKDMRLKWRVRGVHDDIRKLLSAQDAKRAEEMAKQWDRERRAKDGA